VTFIRLLVLALMACSFAGCQTGSPLINPGKYYRVRVTDPRGILVADWIAEGYVARTEYGYRFRAVERLAGGAFPQRARYPYGRHVEATGPNITVSRCGQPYWLYQREQTVVVRDYKETL
jgi:hypothetical protein